MNPVLSVVTITFRDPLGLAFTQKSIASQSGRVEWIVVDGGTNQFREYVAGYSIDTLVSEPDHGIYDAMQKGLALATAEFVIFLNSGDTFSDNNSVEAIEKSVGDSDVCYFGANFLANGRLAYKRPARDPAKYIYHSVPGNQQATVYRRKALQAIGVPQAFPVCGDYALAAMLHIGGYKCTRSEAYISNFSLGGKSTIDLISLYKDAWRVQRDILRVGIVWRSCSLLLRVISTLRTFLKFKIA